MGRQMSLKCWFVSRSRFIRHVGRWHKVAELRAARIHNHTKFNIMSRARSGMQSRYSHFSQAVSVMSLLASVSTSSAGVAYEARPCGLRVAAPSHGRRLLQEAALRPEVLASFAPVGSLEAGYDEGCTSISQTSSVRLMKNLLFIQLTLHCNPKHSLETQALVQDPSIYSR